MKMNMKQTTLATAALLLAAAFGACTQGENEPGGTLPEGKIALTPAVELATGWNTATSTRADQTASVTLAPGGGNIAIGIADVKADGTADMSTLRANFYEVTAEGKLSRLPFKGETGSGEIEEPLNVAAPGEYYILCSGIFNCVTDGITYRTMIANGNESNPGGKKVTIGSDGKVAVPCQLYTGGLRLNVQGTDGNAYAGADVTATLKGVRGEVSTDGSLETKTLTAAAPSVIWGDIDSKSSVAAGMQLLELIVDGKTYKVNAPRQISFTAGRLYTFNVRVGATGIIVSSRDLSIRDFVVQASTAAEADYLTPPLYNGQPANLLNVPGGTPYWVAPENAMSQVAWNDVDFATVCPEGWHVPTRDDFVAMTGLTPIEPVYSGFEPILAAFPIGDYWTSTPTLNGSGASLLQMDANSVCVNVMIKTEHYDVRCVRKK